MSVSHLTVLCRTSWVIPVSVLLLAGPAWADPAVQVTPLTPRCGLVVDVRGASPGEHELRLTVTSDAGPVRLAADGVRGFDGATAHSEEPVDPADIPDDDPSVRVRAILDGAALPEMQLDLVRCEGPSSTPSPSPTGASPTPSASTTSPSPSGSVTPSGSGTPSSSPSPSRSGNSSPKPSPTGGATQSPSPSPSATGGSGRSGGVPLSGIVATGAVPPATVGLEAAVPAPAVAPPPALAGVATSPLLAAPLAAAALPPALAELTPPAVAVAAPAQSDTATASLPATAAARPLLTDATPPLVVLAGGVGALGLQRLRRARPRRP